MSPLRVLLVEDDFLIRTCLAEYLEDLGVAVTEAGSVKEALAIGQDASPDIVVTDLCLPDGDGSVVAGKLRADRPDLPVLYVSGRGPTGGDGASPHDRFVAKPYALGAVAGEIAAMTGRAIDV